MSVAGSRWDEEEQRETLRNCGGSERTSELMNCLGFKP